MNLQNLEGQIQEKLSKPLNVTWIQLEWKREHLEQSISAVSQVVSVKMKERPFRTEDYSLDIHPVWYHEELVLMSLEQSISFQEISSLLIVLLARYKYLINRTLSLSHCNTSISCWILSKWWVHFTTNEQIKLVARRIGSTVWTFQITTMDAWQQISECVNTTVLYV